MWERKSVCGVLMGKPKGKDHLEDPGIDGRINIKMDLQEVDWEGWIDLARDRDRWRALVNVVMNLQVP
jgi:hypothetical protein